MLCIKLVNMQHVTYKTYEYVMCYILLTPNNNNNEFLCLSQIKQKTYIEQYLQRSIRL